MASMIEEILAQIPAEDLAAQLGTDPDTAMDAARKALPALLGGLSGNVSAGGGDALGAAALRDHADDLLSNPDLLNAVDTADGQKILRHIFGDQQDTVVEKLGATSRAGSSIFTKLLPLLAPLVMSWLAKKVGGMFGGGATATSGALAGSQSTEEPAGGLGGLGGLLGGLGGLFGGGGGSEAAAGQSAPLETTGGESGGLGGLGGMLGGLGGSGGLGGLLGGLLGGEVQQAKSSMPDVANLFDLFGEGPSDPEGGLGNS